MGAEVPDPSAPEEQIGELRQMVQNVWLITPSSP